MNEQVASWAVFVGTFVVVAFIVWLDCTVFKSDRPSKTDEG